MTKKLQVVSGDPLAHVVPSPAGLETHGRALWDSVTAEYDISDAGGVAMLTQACRALDRAESCREQIDCDGELIRTVNGPREHPLLKAEIAARSFVVRTLARLGLMFEPVRLTPGRPPGFA